MDVFNLTTFSPLPVFDGAATDNTLAPRPATLDGKVLGLLANWRQSAIPLLEALGAALEQRYRLEAVAIEQPLREPPMGNANMLDSILPKLDQFARRFDVMITASGDCGGGSMWCGQVTAALEKRGVPTVMVATQAFTAFAQRMAAAQGYPYIVIAETQHPIRKLDAETLRVRAAAMLPAVINGFTLQPSEIERRFRAPARQYIPSQDVEHSA